MWHSEEPQSHTSAPLTCRATQDRATAPGATHPFQSPDTAPTAAAHFSSQRQHNEAISFLLTFLCTEILQEQPDFEALHLLFICFLVIPFLQHTKDKHWDRLPTCKLTSIQPNLRKSCLGAANYRQANRPRKQRTTLKPKGSLSH